MKMNSEAVGYKRIPLPQFLIDETGFVSGIRYSTTIHDPEFSRPRNKVSTSFEKKLWGGNPFYASLLRGEKGVDGKLLPINGVRMLQEFGFVDSLNGHIAPGPHGLHHIFAFYHWKFMQNPDHPQILKSAASDLVTLANMHLGRKRPLTQIELNSLANGHLGRSRPPLAQMELWPTLKSFDNVVICADVKQDKRFPFVEMDLTVLLAFQFLLFKCAHDQGRYRTFAFNNKRRAEWGEPPLEGNALPANVPQLYVVDNKSRQMFCLFGHQLRALFEDNPAYGLHCKQSFGAKLRLDEAKNHPVSGDVVLVSMKLEVSAQHIMDCPTDLCLDMVRRIRNELRNRGARLACVTTVLNFSGCDSFGGLDVLSLVRRSRATFGKHSCPICNPYLRQQTKQPTKTMI